MTLLKQQVRELLDHLPDDCTVEDIQNELQILEMIRKRIEMADRGEVVSQAEVEKRMERWISGSNGHLPPQTS